MFVALRAFLRDRGLAKSEADLASVRASSNTSFNLN